MGTKAAFDSGEYVFDQILKQIKYFAIKFPIAFPSFIVDILVKQKLDILTVEDIVRIPMSPLNFSYILFVGKHVSSIVLSNILNFGEAHLSICFNILEVHPCRELLKDTC